MHSTAATNFRPKSVASRRLSNTRLGRRRDSWVASESHVWIRQ